MESRWRGQTSLPNSPMMPLFPPLPAKGSMWSQLRHLGPGLVIASVTIGSGELIMASRSGSIFGYTMFWCFLYAGLFKCILVYSAARHYVVTGEHPLESWRSLPRPMCWLPLILTLAGILIIPVVFGVLPEILGNYLSPLVGFGATTPMMLNFWATGILVCSLGFAVLAASDRLELVSAIILGLMMLALLTSAAAFVPAFREVVSGLLVPRAPEYPGWVHANPAYQSIAGRSPWVEIILYLAAVGGGTHDYLGYLGFVKQKGWGLAGRDSQSTVDLVAIADDPEQFARARAWTRRPLLDLTCSFAVVILVTLLFAYLGANILHPRQLVPDGDKLLSLQEQFLTELHPSFAILYRICVVLAFVGTLIGAFAIFRNALAEGLAVVFRRHVPPADRECWTRWVYAYCFLAGLGMIWLPESLVGEIFGRLFFASLIVGPLGCGLWSLGMFWVNRTRVPERLRLEWIGELGLIFSALMFLGLGLHTVITM